MPAFLPILTTIGFRGDVQKKFGENKCKPLFCMRKEGQKCAIGGAARFGPGSVCSGWFGAREENYFWILRLSVGIND